MVKHFNKEKIIEKNIRETSITSGRSTVKITIGKFFKIRRMNNGFKASGVDNKI